MKKPGPQDGEPVLHFGKVGPSQTEVNFGLVIYPLIAQSPLCIRPTARGKGWDRYDDGHGKDTGGLPHADDNDSRKGGEKGLIRDERSHRQRVQEEEFKDQADHDPFSGAAQEKTEEGRGHHGARQLELAESREVDADNARENGGNEDLQQWVAHLYQPLGPFDEFHEVTRLAVRHFPGLDKNPLPCEVANRLDIFSVKVNTRRNLHTASDMMQVPEIDAIEVHTEFKG